jgi:hypothetical protein
MLPGDVLKRFDRWGIGLRLVVIKVGAACVQAF